MNRFFPILSILTVAVIIAGVLACSSSSPFGVLTRVRGFVLDGGITGATIGTPLSSRSLARDGDPRPPLPGVTVTDLEGGGVTITDDEGRFEIDILATGSSVRLLISGVTPDGVEFSNEIEIAVEGLGEQEVLIEIIAALNRNDLTFIAEILSFFVGSVNGPGETPTPNPTANPTARPRSQPQGGNDDDDDDDDDDPDPTPTMDPFPTGTPTPIPGCGNSVVESPEQCDAGPTGSATCDPDCSLAQCGDSFANALANEACDTGGASATCNANCTVSVCGDGITNTAAGETCDGGGESATCDIDCTALACGDGTANETAGECDESSQNFCSADCVF